jgi:hypothetical protein
MSKNVNIFERNFSSILNSLSGKNREKDDLALSRVADLVVAVLKHPAEDTWVWK